MFRRGKEWENTYHIEVNDIEVEVTRKEIKTIRLKVKPSTGEVRLSCPYTMLERDMEWFIESKIDWIKKQLAKGKGIKPVKEPEFISGETILFKGRELFLKVVQGASKTKVFVDRDQLILQKRGSNSKESKAKAIDDFYRGYLKNEIPVLIKKWEPVLGVKVSEFGVKKMRTVWGTCNTYDSRIWLSLNLAKKEPELLEYVVVHEMVHLLERLHNKRFWRLLAICLPNYKELEDKLNGRID